MWLRLDDDELAVLRGHLEYATRAGRIGADVILAKLHPKHDPDADAFRNAVDTNDDLEVDPDAVVSYGEGGAFVMSWSWVSDKKAGVIAECDNCGCTENDGSDVCPDCGGDIN